MLVPIDQIKPNPKNPRVIKDAKFASLMKSIEDFPQMLDKRPLVCFTDKDGKYVVLGGNMRLKACKELGLKELPILLADEFTEEQKAEFLIKDNLSFGSWNYDELKTDWDVELLDEWGFDAPVEWGLESESESQETEIQDYSDKNKEIDVSDFEDKMFLKLEFTESDYKQITSALKDKGETAEQALFNYLNLQESYE